MSGAELSPMEMTKYESTPLQHLVQVHMLPPAGAPDGPDVRVHPAAGPTPTSSPRTSGQAIDLSAWTDEHCLVPWGEKTPGSCGDVPGSVTARVTAEESVDSPSANSSTSSLRPLRSAAKVCLEKRFDDTDGPRQQDVQAAILNNFLAKLTESSEAPEVLLPQVHKWMKSVEVLSPRREAELNPVTTTCGGTQQAIGQIPCAGEPNTHQGLIFPKSVSFNFGPEMLVTQAQFRSTTEENTRTSSRRRRRRSSAKGDGPDGSVSKKSLQKEQHNSLERERRKMIRLSCDELNALVPFCDAKTDRVTTLQWTTAFLRFISKMFGDVLKKEFQKTFDVKTGSSPESSSSSGPETLSIDPKLGQ